MLSMPTMMSNRRRLSSLLLLIVLLFITAAATAKLAVLPAPQASQTVPTRLPSPRGQSPVEKEVNAINASLQHLKVRRSVHKTQLDSVNAHASSDRLWPQLVAHFQWHQQTHHPEVRRQLFWYLSHKRQLYQMLSNAQPYLYYVYQATRQRRLPAELALLPMIESAYNPFAYSKAGATGLWQMMPGTAESTGLKIDWWYDGRRDTVAATQAALHYLSQLHDHLQNWLLAVAAYNAGMGELQMAVQRNQLNGQPADFWHLQLPRETQRYVPKLLALAAIIQYADYYGVKLPVIANQAQFTAMQLQTQIDLAQAARLAGVAPEVIRRLNPGMRRFANHPSGSDPLLVPASQAKLFQRRLLHLVVDKKTHVSWSYHQVRTGETLASIAHIYHMPLARLKQVNALSSEQVSVGDGLLVPLHLHQHYHQLPLMDTNNAAEDGKHSRNLQQLIRQIYQQGR